MSHPLQEYYSRIYKSYDLVNRLFTIGQDKKWRRHTVQACLSSQPRRILDLCCGTGDLALGLAQAATPGTVITGYDLNPDMLKIARQKAAAITGPGIDFIRGDAASMPFTDNEFDCITIGFGFRNLTWQNPGSEKHLSEMSRVLKPGGRLLILESANPENRITGFFYRFYMHIFLVPLGGLLSGNWQAYRYLAGSSAGFYGFATLQSMLKKHRLNLKTARKYLLGSVNLLIASKI
jgi:demethylmenaquinone methyltransferase/2-methoxy-6-polyprenyl-1,4-benzoquinol methylase